MNPTVLFGLGPDEPAASLRKVLAEYPCELLEVFDGYEALAQAPERRPNLMLLSQALPLLPGMAVFERLQSPAYARLFGDAGLPVLALLGDGDACPAGLSSEIFFISYEIPEAELRAQIAQLLGEGDAPASVAAEPGAVDANASTPWQINGSASPPGAPPFEIKIGPFSSFSSLGELARGLTILLVDDSRVARQLAAKALRAEGLEVLEARHGEEAFAMLQERRGAIDIVLTDMFMPVMDGCTLTRKIRDELHEADMPVLFLTAGNKQEELLAAFQAGATDYLVKPFSNEELMARLSAHLDRLQLLYQRQHMQRELNKLHYFKDNLLTICSYDLLSSSQGILGYTSLLLQTTTCSKEQSEYLKEIETSAKQLLKSIQEILSSAQRGAGETTLRMMPLSLSAVLQQSVQSLARKMEQRGLSWSFEDHAAESIVRGNIGALRRMFDHLLSNAIKFTEPGGKITLKLEPVRPGCVLCRITDTGCGMDAAALQRLFIPDARKPYSANLNEGAGLGMYAVKQIANQHGATIKVSSEPGVGTTVELLFPLWMDSAEDAEQEPFSPNSSPLLASETAEPCPSPAKVLSPNSSLPREAGTLSLIDAVSDSSSVVLAPTATASDEVAVRQASASQELAEQVPDAEVDAPVLLPFNKTSLLRRIDGDKELMELLLAVFLEDAPQQIGALVAALERGDAEESRRNAHALKSAAGSISAEQLHALAEEIEMAGKSGNIDDAERFVSALHEAFAAFQEAARENT